MNFFRQMLQVNQMPSLCDFSRCVLSCSGRVKRPEQCLHEYGFASVWIRTCSFRSMFVLNSFPQKGHSYGLLLLCTWRLWFCKLQDWLKHLLYSEHLYGLSPVWILLWPFRLEDWLNALSHTLHLNGFSPLWILLCWRRFFDVENCLQQTLHLNNLSPEWHRLCTARSREFRHHVPHIEHLYLLVWIFMCRVRLFRRENVFSHWLHAYDLPPVCISLCLVRYCLVVNCLLHTVQWCGLGLSSVMLLLSASVSVLTSNELSPV